MGLERDLTLLEALTAPEGRRRGSLGVARLSAITGIDKSVVSRALRAMEREGVVIRDPDSLGYRIGWRLPTLMVSAEVSTVMRLANRVMRELAIAFPNTVQSFVILRHNRVFLPYNVSGGGSFPDQPWSHRGYPAFCTAPGRALLSDHSLADLRKIYPEGLDTQEFPLTKIQTVEELAQLVRTARETGFAASDGERQPGRAGAAAPIRDEDGRIIAAINVSGLQLPEAEPHRRQTLDQMGRQIGHVVSQVSSELGWIPFAVG